MLTAVAVDPVRQALVDVPDAWLVVVGLAPLGTPLVAAVAAWVALRTLGQRSRSDDRAHWWTRTAWALERVEEERRRAVEGARHAHAASRRRTWFGRRVEHVGSVGEAESSSSIAFQILEAQVASRLAKRDDTSVVDVVSRMMLGDDAPLGDEGAR